MKILDFGALFGMGVAKEVFSPWNPELPNIKTIKEAEKEMPSADLICFGGGQDIHPSIYGQKVAGAYCGPYMSMRDLFEIEIWKLAIDLKKPIFGVCRGAQLSCAMSGGQLLQDVNGHGGNGHIMDTHDGQKVMMTTTHHQMMYPGDIPHTLIAWTKGIVQSYQVDIGVVKDEIDLEEFKEPEIIWFPVSNALAIQGHPEYYSSPNAPPVVYVRKLVNDFLGVKPE